MKRSSPMRRGGPIARKTKLRPVNPERKKVLYERNFGAKADWVRTLPCLVGYPNCRLWQSDPAHVVARGMGGCGGDKSQLVPLCRPHHVEQETSGVLEFNRRYHLDLAAEAARLEAEWKRRG